MADLNAMRGTKKFWEIVAINEAWKKSLPEGEADLYERYVYAHKYECTTCMDTGFVPPYHVKQTACPDCDKGYRTWSETIKRLRASSGIPTIYQHYEMGKWLVLDEKRLQNKDRAISVAQALSRNRFEPIYEEGDEIARNWLMLTGPPGTGKTALACTLGNIMIDEHLWSVAFIHVPSWLDRLKWTYKADYDGPSSYKLEEPVHNARLVILDEMNVPSASDHDVSKLQAILDGRYRAGLPTIMTANVEVENRNGYTRSKSLETIWGTATVDRVYERAFWVEMSGLSLRR